MIATKLPTTLQEIFDNAWHHAVVEQMPPSIGMGGNCAYRSMLRSGEPNACLIGVSIPDSRYSESLEGQGADDEMFLAEFPEWRAIEPLLLHDLQRAHDSIADLPSPTYLDIVEQILREFAAANNLKIPED